MRVFFVCLERARRNTVKGGNAPHLYNRYIGRGDTGRAHQARGSEKKEVPLMRVKITLACTDCKQRNYDTIKNKKNDPDRLEMNKFCRFCRKHTVHRETK